VFNGIAQTEAEYVQQLVDLGVRYFRLKFVKETPDQVTQAIHRYRQLLQGEIIGTQLCKT
jgi:putative protease